MVRKLDRQLDLQKIGRINRHASIAHPCNKLVDPIFSPNLKRGDFKMPLAELKSQIQELSKIDKLRLMQFLATELVKEEDATNFFVADREYPVWSPYNCSEAANVLMNLLTTKQQEQND
ncbi:hypothetical protein K4039_20295 [Lyngbya sp. CCAP 1446/10]|uniref:hypothetical protein n=2 Tax=Microcoleaceae TaxID=1892252 RepID=UPI002238ABE3|nr:hypothetical protein [Lyngbya sp. CCAP 1446/10]MCW6052369.1 hypothetical protein [Lyngbya sp. CCAP 1446/10]